VKVNDNGHRGGGGKDHSGGADRKKVVNDRWKGGKVKLYPRDLDEFETRYKCGRLRDQSV